MDEPISPYKLARGGHIYIGNVTVHSLSFSVLVSSLYLGIFVWIFLSVNPPFLCTLPFIISQPSILT